MLEISNRDPKAPAPRDAGLWVVGQGTRGDIPGSDPGGKEGVSPTAARYVP